MLLYSLYLTELEVTSNRSTNSLKSSQIVNKSIESNRESKSDTHTNGIKLNKMKSPKKVFYSLIITFLN